MTLPRLFLLSWLAALTAVVGPLLVLNEMSSLGGWRAILPWSVLVSVFAFFVFVVPVLLGLRQALRGNVALRHFALAGSCLGVVLTVAFLLFFVGGVTDMMVEAPSLYLYAAFAVVGAIIGCGFARLPASSLEAARWWWPLGKAFVAMPIVGFATSLVGIPVARGRPEAMFVLSLATGLLIGISLIVGIAVLIAGKRVGNLSIGPGVKRGIGVSAFLCVLWVLTHQIGAPQVQGLRVSGMQVPAASRDLSTEVTFGPLPLGGDNPFPYHWCTARACAPGLVVANRGIMRGGLDGDGETALVLWVFGATWKLCVIREWVS